MRVAILTSGRFHVLDLARELHRLGHDVAFYSLLPDSRTSAFGLPSRCNRSLLLPMAPFLAARRIVPAADRLLRTALDHFAAHAIRPCDLLIGMSGLTIQAARAVRRKYGAQVWLERGSRHIRSQKEILDAIPGLPASSGVPAADVAREEQGYELADVIVLGSQHCEESFLERGFPADKLFRNPYGVDLTMFAPTEAPPPGTPPTILNTGTWCLRKGCDTLAQAWEKLPGTRLLHVGPVTDAPLPTAAGFRHVDRVNQSELRKWYGEAHIFALPSREDGFGVVMTQALSAGLPVVASSLTGGPDLAAMLPDQQWVKIVPPDEPNALAAALREALDLASTQSGLRQVLAHTAAQFSWEAYGERYHREILRRFH